MAAKRKPVSSGDVIGKLKEWKEWVVFIFGTAAALVVAWNSKANTSDLEQVRGLVKEQTSLTHDLDLRLKNLEALREDYRALQQRIDKLVDSRVSTAP